MITSTPDDADDKYDDKENDNDDDGDKIHDENFNIRRRGRQI